LAFLVEIKPLEKNILVIAPTSVELAAARHAACGGSVDFATTGIGMLQTAYNLTELLCRRQYRWVVCAGIAGAFAQHLHAGDIVAVRTETADDLSAMYIYGYHGAFPRGLLNKNDAPFENEILHCQDAACAAAAMNCMAAASLSVSLLAQGSEQALQRRQFYGADIENMEGAAFFYVCSMKKVRFVQVRAIANAVGMPHEQWNIPLALENLTKSLKQLLCSKMIC
jgi:futalosine hydrolase